MNDEVIDTHHVVAKIIDLLVEASSGDIRAEAAREDLTFPEMGLTSLGLLRLIYLVEEEFGVHLHLDEDSESWDSIAGIVRQVVRSERVS